MALPFRLIDVSRGRPGLSEAHDLLAGSPAGRIYVALPVSVSPLQQRR